MRLFMVFKNYPNITGSTVFISIGLIISLINYFIIGTFTDALEAFCCYIVGGGITFGMLSLIHFLYYKIKRRILIKRITKNYKQICNHIITQKATEEYEKNAPYYNELLEEMKNEKN